MYCPAIVSPNPSPGPRTPVLVGVGTAHRPVDGSGAVDAVELMVEAVLAAARDAGAEGLAGRAEMVAVPEGNRTSPDDARLVADRVGAVGARTVRVDVGVPQATAVAGALDRIANGAVDVALVVGGEAMASRLASERSGGPPVEVAQEGVEPDERWSPQGEILADAEVQAGIWAPVEQYACIDNALRHAEGRTVDQHLDEIAALWAACNAVAVTNPLAAFGEPRTAAFLRSAGPGNRPLAFPYARWHSTQWSVDQAAALLVCSVGAARAAGVSPDRWIFPHVAVESSHSVSLTRRAEIHRWPAMAVLGAAAGERLGRPLAEVDHIECYSCFPAAVRVQQRELGLPPGGVPTITGGMAFAGGPFNNFTYQATAAMAARLREQPEHLGLITTVSGVLTKPALTVWAGHPPPAGALVADYGAEVAAVTPSRDVTHIGSGPGTVVTYTVTYEGDRPARAFVVADLDDGRRWIGTTDHPELVERGTIQEIIGLPVRVHGLHCTPA